MANTVDLVRYRNDGDDFHLLWTARQALKLLDPKSELVAISVEGVSENESSDKKTIQAGELGIDTAEYYGSQKLPQAKRFIYCQLKYSTTASCTPWNIGGLKKTLKYFAQRFIELVSEHGNAAVAHKVRFRFVTNRPISASLLSDISGQNASNAIRKKLRSATGLTTRQLNDFLPLLELCGQQPGRAQQSMNLENEAGKLLTHMDSTAALKMRQLIHSKTLSEAKNNKTITRETVLNCLGFVQDELFPSTPILQKLSNEIPREQNSSIIQTILRTNTPIVISAAGGVGKSILAQRICDLLPKGSETVIFDGFAAGSYRSPRDSRHQHEKGLVHIANTLAMRGLCDILLPAKGASNTAFLNALRRRLAQASLVVKKRSDKAIVAIILDAADNSMMVANEQNEKSFVSDLLQEAPPDGCKIIALSRPERIKYLSLPQKITRISLLPFSKDESSRHLRSKFKSASDAECLRFHKFTDSNPRVQANALADHKRLPSLMAAIGPSIKTVDRLIMGQLNDALARLKEEQGLETEVKSLCTALAILPPLIPIDVLSLAAGVSTDLIKSFVSDFAGGRHLFLYNNAIQFRDEPVETWFRTTFPPTPINFGRIADCLQAHSLTNRYVASTIPQLLLGANRYSRLIDLALVGEPYATKDIVEQREVLVHRVRYALKAAINRNQHQDVAKLMLRVAEETIIDERQARFFLSNADLITELAGTDTVFNFVFSKRAWQLEATGYLRCAAMLAVAPAHKDYAIDFLKLSHQWLNDWISLPKAERPKINLESIVDLTFAQYLLFGAEAATKELSRWQPETVSFKAGKLLTRRLIDAGKIQFAHSLITYANDNIYLKLAIIEELMKVCSLPQKHEVQIIVKSLIYNGPKKILGEGDIEDEISASIVSLAEAAAAHKVAAKKVLAILSNYRPIHKYTFDHWQHTKRDAVIRAAVLGATVGHKEFKLEDITPSSLLNLNEEQKDSKPEWKRFLLGYGLLVPWYQLRISALLHSSPRSSWKITLSNTIKNTKQPNSWSSNDLEFVGGINEISILHLEAILWQSKETKQELDALHKWVGQQNKIYTPTWRTLARLVSKSTIGHKYTLEFANQAKQLLFSEHIDAESISTELVSLARAVLSIDKDESTAYFKLALEHMGRVGDEGNERLSAILAVSRQTALSGGSHPREAYRLARAAELFASQNDNDFRWPDVAATITALCPTSGLAIMSRWHDRKQGWLETILPAVINELLKKEQISTMTATALHVFSRHWDYRRSARYFFNKNLSKTQQQTILNALIQDLELNESWEKDAESFITLANDLHLNATRLKEHCAFHKSIASSSPKIMGTSVQANKNRPNQKSQWKHIFYKSALNTPKGIEEIFDRFKKSPVPFQWHSLYKEIGKRVPIHLRLAYINALCNSSLELWQILDMLQEAAETWQASEAITREIANSVKSLIKERPLEFTCGMWRTNRDITRCVTLSKATEREILIQLLESLSNHVADVPSTAWFYFAGETARLCLAPTESLQVLSFALDRLEPFFMDTDGDGVWRTELIPPKRISEAVAKFIFSILSSPFPEERWLAAHSVRRLCEFEQKKEISTLVSLLETQQLPAFTDSRYPFYYRHGRLYLLIALARVSLDNPAFLKQYFKTFCHISFHDEPHVLMRHFSTFAAKNIAMQYPAICPRETFDKLLKVNDTPFPPRLVTDTYKFELGSKWKSRSFYLDHDFEHYWLGSLAKAFSLNTTQISNKIGDYIKNKWPEKYSSAWKDDPRAQAGHFKSLSSYLHQGRYPSADRFSFYLSYHAAFCIAGELLATRPINIESSCNEKENLWIYWLKQHLLTRPDNKWLSDRRDYPPLKHPRWLSNTYLEKDHKAWLWEIIPADFDQAIGISTNISIDKVIVWGTSHHSDGNRDEDIRVSSALVSSINSLALLQSLQYTDSFHDYYIPTEDDSAEIFNKPFELRGWIHTPETANKNLDQLDPISGAVQWPVISPGRIVRRVWKLTCDGEERIWKTNVKTVFETSTWGTPGEPENRNTGNRGLQLQADFGFLLEILHKLSRDLIIEVRINRYDKTQKEENNEYYRYNTYARLYLLKSDGTLHTTSGSRRLRAKATQRIKI